MTETPDMSVEIARWTRACRMRIKRYLRELYDQPKVAFSFKTRTVKAEVIEALLYGCSTWTLHKEYYSKLLIVQHRVLLRIIGAQRKRLDNVAHDKTFVAGALIRMSDWRLPKRISWEILRLQCGLDGAGKRKSGPVAYRATPGYLAWRGKGACQDGHGGWAEVYGRVEERRDIRG